MRPPIPVRGRRPGFGLLLAVAVTLAGCGSSTPARSASTSVSSTTAVVTGPSVDAILHSSTVVVGGREVAVPDQVGSRPVSPTYDMGQHVLVSVGGVLPKWLFATRGEPVVWTNLTDQPQQIVFDHLQVRSPPILPGGTWTFTTVSSESISYHTTSGMHGVVETEPPNT